MAAPNSQIRDAKRKTRKRDGFWEGLIDLSLAVLGVFLASWLDSSTLWIIGLVVILVIIAARLFWKILTR